MIDSEYLDLAVGMAVVFFLAGMVVSGLNEGIAWLTRVRAKFLWSYLYDLFDGDRSARALPRGRLGITKLWGKRNDKRPAAGGSTIALTPGAIGTTDWLSRVAYALDPIDAPQLLTHAGTLTTIKSVPASSLAQGFLEVFADVGRQEVTRSVGVLLDRNAEAGEATVAIDRATQLLDAGLKDVRDAFTTFHTQLAATGDASDEAMDQARRDAADALTGALLALHGSGSDPRLRDAWRAASQAWPTGPSDDQLREVVDATARLFPANFARLRVAAAIAELDPQSPLAPTLRRLWEVSSGEIDTFRGNVESYFDGEFQRLSGYYRRCIRTVTFALALLVALVGGVDAISVGRNLWRNPNERAALVQLADDVAQDGTPITTSDAAGTGIGLERIQQECAKAHPTDADTINGVDDAADAYAKVRNCVSGALDQLTGVAVINRALWVDAGAWWADWANSRFWVHAIGITFTALALMLGAPFWFDIIKRLTGLRKGPAGDT